MNKELKQAIVEGELASSKAMLQPLFNGCGVDPRIANNVYDVIGLALRTALGKIELHELNEIITRRETQEPDKTIEAPALA